MKRRNFFKAVTGFVAGIFAFSQGHFELYNAFGNKILWIKGSKWPPRVIKVCDDKGVEFEYIPKDDRRKD